MTKGVSQTRRDHMMSLGEIEVAFDRIGDQLKIQLPDIYDGFDWRAGGATPYMIIRLCEDND